MNDYTQTIEQFNAMPPAQQAFTLIFSIAISVLLIIAEWKIFTKAGQRGWYSLIPFLREYKLCEIIDGNGFKFLLLFIPFVNIIYGIILDFRMAKAYGKGVGFGFGILFFPYIFWLILGFGSAEYVGPNGQRGY